MARAVGLDNEQTLPAFLSESPWTVRQWRGRGRAPIRKGVEGRRLVWWIDETSECPKGCSPAYVKRQDIGHVGQKENGMVAVSADGRFPGLVLPLPFEVYKPRERLKAGDEYRRQAPIAAAMIRDLHPLGCHVEGGLADSLDGEATPRLCDRFGNAEVARHGGPLQPSCRGATARASGLVRTWADLDAHLERWPPRNALSASRHL